MEHTLPHAAENQLITHPQYRQIALTIYVGVLILGLFGWLSSTPLPVVLSTPSLDNILLFCTAIFLLIVLEFGQQSLRFGNIIQPKGYLLIQILLSSLALANAPYSYAQFLFLIVILFAELTFSRQISMLTIAVTFSFLFLRLAFGPRGDFISTRDAESLLIFGLAMWLILLLARSIKEEWQNRLNLQSLNDKLHQSHQQLQASSEQLAEMAVVTERNRLARDIHDSLGHHLAAVSIQLEMAIKLHEQLPSKSLQAMKQAKTATQAALQDVRKSVGGLRSQDEPFDFESSVKLLIERISNDNLNISYRLDGNVNTHAKSTHLTFFRAIQEGLTNIHKHASASHANIWLQFSTKQAHLRIVDDGIGFDPQWHTDGMGLQGVRERVKSLGGHVQIDSRPNEGTIIDIRIPQVV